MAKLNREIGRALTLPDVAQRLTASGAEPQPGMAALFGKMLAQQLEIYAALAKRAGIKAE